ncbi:MAG: hypothetical protein ACTHZ7_14450 [Sphingobacterium sp.]
MERNRFDLLNHRNPVGGPEEEKLADYSFQGTGIVMRGNVTGPEDYIAKVEVHLDGELTDTVNLPAMSKARRYERYHVYQLPKKGHTLTLKLLNPLDSATINIVGLVEYSDDPTVWLSKKE